jgi:lipopolysaccharide export system protein LptC
MLNRPHTLFFPVVALTVLAFMTFWIDHTVKFQMNQNTRSHPHDVDYFLNDFVTTRTDANGHIHQILAATEMKHYIDNDTTELTRPRFTMYSPNRPFTQIEGQKGLVSSNGELVQFKGDVHILRGAYDNHPETRISTDHVNIYPNQDKASTDSQVTITQGSGTKITSQGMDYDKTEKTFKFNSRVKVHYEKLKSNSTIIEQKNHPH